ncbi:MAG: FMN-binding protein [Bacteroidales bacterium]|nr:FMN-binding protein [Bacteroidales bacterium]
MSSESKNPVLDLIKTALTLFVIAALVAVLLAVANYVTAPIIARSAQERLNQSLNSLMSEAVTFESVDVSLVEYSVPVYAVYRGLDKTNAEIGFCVHVAPNGYSDTIEMMVAIDKDGAVSGVRILSIADTPGIGMKVDTDEQFQNSVLGFSETFNIVKGTPASPNDVQVISGASVSSTAYLTGVNTAIEVAKEVAAR